MWDHLVLAGEDMLDCLGAGGFRVALRIKQGWNLAVNLWIDRLVPLNESKDHYYIEIERDLVDIAVLRSDIAENLDIAQLRLEVAH